MAEAVVAVGIAANFAGVIGAGLSIARSLYELVHVLGSAVDNINSLATDINLFCAVLKQVESTLKQARAYRLSMSAIDTAQAVINRCKIIFDQVKAAVTKLQSGRVEADFKTKVKWYFKEKRVLLIHAQLQTSGATLHLMLSTLQFAQKIASNRNSGVDQDDQDDGDRLMTHSLFMTQQAAIDHLATVESQLADEDDAKPVLVRGRRRASPDHADPYLLLGSVLGSSAAEARPLSTILAGHFNRLSLARSSRYSHLSDLDDRRLSILQTDELLRQWTDQIDPLAGNQAGFDGEGNGPYGSDEDSVTGLDKSQQDDGDAGQTALPTSSTAYDFFVPSGPPTLPYRQDMRLRTWMGARPPSEMIIKDLKPHIPSSPLLRSNFEHQLGFSRDSDGGTPASSPHSIPMVTPNTGPAQINGTETSVGPSYAPTERADTPDFRRSLAPYQQAGFPWKDRKPSDKLVSPLARLHNKLNSANQVPAAKIAPVVNARATMSYLQDSIPPKEEEDDLSFISFKVGREDRCYQVLSLALKGYNIQGNWRDYALYIDYGDQTRRVGIEEIPWKIFNGLEEEGSHTPKFRLRMLSSLHPAHPILSAANLAAHDQAPAIQVLSLAP